MDSRYVFDLHIRRADVMPVGDLGVQKGLIKWILSAYANQPYPSDETALSTIPLPNHQGPSVDSIIEPPRPPPTDLSSIVPAPETASHKPIASQAIVFPPTPANTSTDSLDGVRKSAVSNGGGDEPAVDATEAARAKKRLEATLHLCPEGYVPDEAYPFDGIDGMSVDTLKARLGGKKLKGGAYLSPTEMEQLTAAWKPYRSLGVYYMWAVAEEGF